MTNNQHQLILTLQSITIKELTCCRSKHVVCRSEHLLETFAIATRQYCVLIKLLLTLIFSVVTSFVQFTWFRTPFPPSLTMRSFFGYYRFPSLAPHPVSLTPFLSLAPQVEPMTFPWYLPHIIHPHGVVKRQLRFSIVLLSEWMLNSPRQQTVDNAYRAIISWKFKVKHS